MKNFLLLLIFCTSCSELALIRKFQVEPAATLPIPVIAHGSSFDTGCWLRLYDEENMQGEALLIHSGKSLRTLQFNDISDWRGRIVSFEVGPEATAEFFRLDNFKNSLLKAGPATRLRGLSGGSVSPARSVKLNCRRRNYLLP